MRWSVKIIGFLFLYGLLAITFILTTRKREPIKSSTCDSNSADYLKFLGKHIYTLSPSSPTVEFSHHCFKKNVATITVIGTKAKIVIDSSQPASKFCSDIVIITDLIDIQTKFTFFSGKNEIEVDLSSEKKLKIYQDDGIQIVLACDSWTNFIRDAALTTRFFRYEITDGTSFENRQQNMDQGWDQLGEQIGIQKIQRNPKVKLTRDWLRSNVESGDCYCTYSATGTDSLTSWATNGICSHSGMFLWGPGDSDDLFYVESNTGDSGQHADIVYDRWTDDNFTSRILLKMNPETRKKFDKEKAWAWFQTVEHAPYGYENLIYAIIDTKEDNYPQVMNLETMLLWMRIVDSVDKTKSIFDLYIGASLNKRLGTEGLNFVDLVYEADKQKTTFLDQFIIPEKEGLLYGEDQRQRFMCSAFTAALLKHGGAFGDLEILPHEFSPKDIMSLAFWESQTTIPECLQNDPDLPYCQFSGVYKFVDPTSEFSTITPYNRMNERCPRERTPGC